MKLLLDECAPKRLVLDFAGHDVRTVAEAGLKGLKNGVLLQQASRDFNVLITVDQNIPFQQNRANLPICSCNTKGTVKPVLRSESIGIQSTRDIACVTGWSDREGRRG